MTTTTRYSIRDPQDTPVAVHVRRDDERGKGFHWEQPDGTRGLGGISIADLPLYGSEAASAWSFAEPVFVVEGEKAADSLKGLGFQVLGTVTGSSACPSANSLEVLRGHDTILWPDADGVGRKHMSEVAGRLAGVAANARVFSWSDAPDKGDAHDYLSMYPDAADRLRTELATAAPATGWLGPTAPRSGPKGSPRESKRTQGKGLVLETVEPAADALDGLHLFEDLGMVLERYMVLPPHAGVAVSLWISLTYLTEVVEVLPRLLLTSPTRECGKTRLLAIIAALVQRPLSAASITAAGIFRAIDAASPTLLLDEADNGRMEDNPELRAVLNSGHTRASAWTVRNVGEDHDPRRFSTWAPIALACIGSLPDPVTSRAIRVPMRRRARHELVERVRESRLGAELEGHRRQLARWAADHAEEIRLASPKELDALGDRDADNWEPLFAIADAIGGNWPARARVAALALCGSGKLENQSFGELLLADLRDVFGDAEKLPTEGMLSELNRLDDRPWCEWARGRPLTPRGLATLLKPFGILPRGIRLPDGGGRKGYLREELEDAWRRYLAEDSTPIRHTVTRTENGGAWRASDPSRRAIGNGTSNATSAAACAGCDAVADREGRGTPLGAKAISEAPSSQRIARAAGGGVSLDDADVAGFLADVLREDQ